MHKNNSPINIIGIDIDQTLEDELSTMLNPTSFCLHMAQSLEQGIFALDGFNADVVIISSSLPEDDRLKICRKLKTISKTPILVLSISDRPGLLEQTLDAGADEYLIKPISRNLLNAHLNTLVRRFREEKKASRIQKLKE